MEATNKKPSPKEVALHDIKEEPKKEGKAFLLYNRERTRRINSIERAYLNMQLNLSKV